MQLQQLELAFYVWTCNPVFISKEKNEICDIIDEVICATPVANILMLLQRHLNNE